MALILFLDITSDFLLLPFELYNIFQIKEVSGFNKMTFKMWFKDYIKEKILTIVLIVPTIWTILWIIFTTGDNFILYVAIFLTIFVLLLVVIAPTCLMPIFNQYDPIADNPLKVDIENLANILKYPLSKIEVVDGSKRSGHSNAFQYGFGKIKKIVMFDTLLE